jgi:hypothetical protein
MKRRADTCRAMTTRTENTGPARVEQSLPIPTEKTRARAEAISSKGRFYKPLPKEFRRDGFSYRQIAREGDAAIYEQTWGYCADPSVCYEVIRVKRREGFVVDGRFVEPAEVYAPSKLWGVDGFTFNNRNTARAKFFEMSLEEPANRGKEVKNGKVL